jgi:hypothetical protein
MIHARGNGRRSVRLGTADRLKPVLHALTRVITLGSAGSWRLKPTFVDARETLGICEDQRRLPAGSWRLKPTSVDARETLGVCEDQRRLPGGGRT